MNATIEKTGIEASLAAAAALLGGGEVATKTVLAVYQLGRMNGLLEMANADAKRVDAVMRSSL